MFNQKHTWCPAYIFKFYFRYWHFNLHILSLCVSYLIFFNKQFHKQNFIVCLIHENGLNPNFIPLRPVLCSTWHFVKRFKVSYARRYCHTQTGNKLHIVPIEPYCECVGWHFWKGLIFFSLFFERIRWVNGSLSCVWVSCLSIQKPAKIGIRPSSSQIAEVS